MRTNISLLLRPSASMQKTSRSELDTTNTASRYLIHSDSASLPVHRLKTGTWQMQQALSMLQCNRLLCNQK